MAKEFGPIRPGTHSITIYSTTDTVDLRSATGDLEDSDGHPVRLKCLYVGVTGTLELMLSGMSTFVLFYNVPVGNWVFGEVIRVGTNTTADELVGQYDQVQT